MDQVLETAIKHWRYIAPLAHKPANKKEFDKLVARLDELLERVEDDENHRLMGLLDLLSQLILTKLTIHN